MATYFVNFFKKRANQLNSGFSGNLGLEVFAITCCFRQQLGKLFRAIWI